MEEALNHSNYAHLPEELLGKILENIPATVDKMNKLFDVQEEPIRKGIEFLRDKGFIEKVQTTDFSTSLIAADGGVILEKMTGTDILLAVAVGVEGLTSDNSNGWNDGKNQYYQWQTVLPHDEANPRLCQGVMFLMELSVLANSSHEIRIMDGTHFTPILKINSLLSASEDKAGHQYVQALREFLHETYKKIIPDIPNIVEAALNDEKIISIAKYSSSRDIIDAFLKDQNISIDDKTFFSIGLNEDEYLIPRSVGQSIEEREKIWDDLHIRCNLKISDNKFDQIELNKAFEKAVNKLRTKNEHTGSQQSELYFTYYKPYPDGPAYRIEIKKSLALDKAKLEKYLLSIKKQIVFPEIQEPFPQYLVDLMAKNVSGGLYAIQEAIRLSPSLKLDKGKFNLLFNYRT
ncbi:MAG TPA: DNA double-strand break repair nuclease NurA [Chitinophagaceae bacterium]|nr:DNA double-strand break repair nuclease NurA [Chitinophagaceae bacterium]